MSITRYLDPKTDPAFKRLFGTEKNNAFNWSPAELAEYEASKKAELDLKARDDYHKKEGRAEGKAEMIRNMLVKGFAIKEVAEIANLSQEEVEQLSKEIKN
jgi:predicted transposase YdaD